MLAALGLLVYILAMAGRFYGEPTILGFQAINIFNVGTGFLVLGCFVKLSKK